MERIRTILIEDEPLARENCMRLVRKSGLLDLIGVFENPIDAMPIVESGKAELILSDIQMPEMDGISFLRSLEQPPFVIFITGYPDFAVDGFELDVLDYIIKPLTEQRFFKAVEKVRKALDYNRSNDREEYVKIKDRNQTTFLKPEEIFYARGWGDYSKLNTIDSEVTLTRSLKEMESILPKKYFIRIQRSFIVNIRQIASVDATKVTLKKNIKGTSGKEIKETLPIGLQYRKNFYDRMGIKE